MLKRPKARQVVKVLLHHYIVIITVVTCQRGALTKKLCAVLVSVQIWDAFAPAKPELLTGMQMQSLQERPGHCLSSRRCLLKLQLLGSAQRHQGWVGRADEQEPLTQEWQHLQTHALALAASPSPCACMHHKERKT